MKINLEKIENIKTINLHAIDGISDHLKGYLVDLCKNKPNNMHPATILLDVTPSEGFSYELSVEGKRLYTAVTGRIAFQPATDVGYGQKLPMEAVNLYDLLTSENITFITI